MNAAEVKRVAEETAKHRKRLEAIYSGLKPRLRNVRHVVNFEFDGTPPGLSGVERDDGAPYAYATQSIIVKKGTLLDVVAVEHAYTAVGTLESTGEAAQLTLPYWVMTRVFDFYFKLYDSGSDREWQNELLPSWVLASDNANGFWFGGPDSDGRSLLSSGSELVVTAAPYRNTNNSFVTGLSQLSSHQLQISFVGVEVTL